MAPPTTGLLLEEVQSATAGRRVSGRMDRQVEGISIDSRTVKAGELFVAVVGPRFDGHDFLADAAWRGATAALVHKDVVAPPDMDVLRVTDTTRALADLARHLRTKSNVPLAAITGSVGKTTTKEMAAALVSTKGPVLKTEGNLNNQFGLPLTLLRLRGHHKAAVVEVGMSEPGEIRALTKIAQPDVAVITNVAPVHLEFFRSLEDIARAKAEILEGLRPSGAAVLNGDDSMVRMIGRSFKGKTLWYGHDRRFDVLAENFRGTAFGMRFDLFVQGEKVDIALPCPGPHFLMDFLAAATTAHLLGVRPHAMAEAALAMKPASHRGEILALGSEVMVFDDSYNSSPVAVEAAIVALSLAGKRRKVAFLGDMLELGPSGPGIHLKVGASLARRLDVLVAVGPLASRFAEGASRQGLDPKQIYLFPDSSAAAAAVCEIVVPGDAVLVKGSHGTRMERIVEALAGRFRRVEG